MGKKKAGGPSTITIYYSTYSAKCHDLLDLAPDTAPRSLALEHNNESIMPNQYKVLSNNFRNSATSVHRRSRLPPSYGEADS